MSQYVRFPLDRFIQGRIRLQNPDKLDFDYRARKIAGPWVPHVASESGKSINFLRVICIGNTKHFRSLKQTISHR